MIVKKYLGTNYLDELFYTKDTLKRLRKEGVHYRPTLLQKLKRNANRKRDRVVDLVKTNYILGRGLFVTIKPEPRWRTDDYSLQNRRMKSFLNRISHSWISINEKNDKNPDSVVYGTYHTHAVIFDVDYVEKALLEKAYGHGFVDVQALQNVKVALYITKYITKDNQGRLIMGRNTSRPIIVKCVDGGFDMRYIQLSYYAHKGIYKIKKIKK